MGYTSAVSSSVVVRSIGWPALVRFTPGRRAGSRPPSSAAPPGPAPSRPLALRRHDLAFPLLLMLDGLAGRCHGPLLGTRLGLFFTPLLGTRLCLFPTPLLRAL